MADRVPRWEVQVTITTAKGHVFQRGWLPSYTTVEKSIARSILWTRAAMSAEKIPGRSQVVDLRVQAFARTVPVNGNKG